MKFATETVEITEAVRIQVDEELASQAAAIEALKQEFVALSERSQ